MKHIINSTEARAFFNLAGIEITNDSCHNAVTLKHASGFQLTMWAESDASVAAGIPGIYIDEVPTMTHWSKAK